MSRFMTFTWVVQCLFFLTLAVVLLLFPVQWFTLMHNVSLGLLMNSRYETEGEIIVATMRMSATLAITMALFSAHAAMREDRPARRQIARTFGVLFTIWSVSTYLKTLESIHTHYERWFGYVIAAFTVINLVHGFAPVYRRRVRPLSGMANTRPAQLWVLWLMQSIFYLACGLLLSLTTDANATWAVRLQSLILKTAPVIPDQAFTAFVRTSEAHGLVRQLDLVQDQLEAIPPYLVGIGLFGLYAMRASREWVWRFLSGVFAAANATMFAVFLFVWNPTVFQSLAFVLLTMPMVFFGVGNWLFARRPLDYFTHDIGQGPDGWTVTDLTAGPLLMFRTFVRRGRRSLAPMGVGATGYFEVAPVAPDLVTDAPVKSRPTHDFFTAGGRYPLQLRFSNRRSRDDASLDVRAVALRFADKEHSPLDLSFFTGSYSESENMVQFMFALLGFTRSRRWRTLGQGGTLQVREAAIAGLRRAPGSYAQLRYHTQLVRFWIDGNDVRHLVRFRFVPEEVVAANETGLPRFDDPGKLGERLPDERRAPDYLRRELKTRLGAGSTVRMRLEAQFHRPQPGDGLQWYNPGVDWRGSDHLWFLVGTAVIEATTPDDAAEMLRFNPDHHPPSLAIPTSFGPFDPRSMADSERRVVSRVQAMRAWMHSIVGVPGQRTETEE